MWSHIVKAALLPLKLLVGFDAFISYYRLDGTDYAQALHNELGRSIRPRIDLEETRPHPDLPFSLRVAIAFSKVLVVLNTPGATHSQPVGAEIETFLKWSGGPVLPVELGCPLEEADWWPLLKGTPRIQEDDSAVREKMPSSKVIKGTLLKVGFWNVSRRQTLLLALFGSILLGLIFSAWQAKKQRDDAITEKQRAITETAQERENAENARKEAKDTTAKLKAAIHNADLVSYNAAIRVASEALSSAELQRARDALESVQPKGEEEDLRGFEWYRLWRRAYPPYRSLSWSDCRPDTISLNHDGNLIAVACRTSANPRGEVRILSLKNPSEIRTTISLEKVFQIRSVAFSPKNDSLTVVWDREAQSQASGRREPKITERRITFLHYGPTPPPERKIDNCLLPVSTNSYQVTDCRLKPAGLAFSPDGQDESLAYGVAYSADGEILLADRTGTQLSNWVGRFRSFRYEGWQTPESVRVSPKGRYFGAIDSGKPCWRKLDLEGPTPRRCIAESVKDSFQHLAFASEELLVAGGKNGLSFFSLPDGDVARSINAPEVTTLASLTNGLIATGDREGMVTLWTTEGQRFDVLRGHVAAVKFIAMSPEVPILASLGEDNVVDVWNITERMGEYDAGPEMVDGMPSCDGKSVLRRMNDGLYREAVRILTLPFPNRYHYPAISEDCTVIADYTGQGNYVFSFFSDGSRRSQRKSYMVSGLPDGGAYEVIYSPDSHLAAMGVGLDAAAESIWVADLSRQKTIRIPQPAKVASMALSNVGQLVAAYGDGGIRMWDVSGNSNRLLRASTGKWSGAVAIDPTGRFVAWGPSSRMATIALLDLRDDLLATVTASSRDFGLTEDSDWALKFSPDGKTLVFLTPNGNVTLINTRTLSRFFAFDLPDFGVRETRFTEYGTDLVFGGWQGSPPFFRALRLRGSSALEVFERYDWLAGLSSADEGAQRAALTAARDAYRTAIATRSFATATMVRRRVNSILPRLGKKSQNDFDLKFWSSLGKEL